MLLDRLRADVPRRRHARHRPRAARLHVPARERRPHRRRRRHPRPRGPRRRAAVPAARAVASRSTARRSRSASPATASRRPACSGATELIAVVDGERRTIGPFDVEFIPVTHSRAPRPRRSPCTPPQGVILHSGDFKLDLTPVDGRRTDLARIGAIATQRGHPRCCWPTRPTPRSRATRRARPASARCCARSSPSSAGRRIITASFASHLHRIQQIADAAIADGPRRRHARAEHEEERAARPSTSACSTSPTSSLVDIEDIDRLRAGRGLRDLHRLAGRADVGAGAAGPRREQVRQARRHTTR